MALWHTAFAIDINDVEMNVWILFSLRVCQIQPKIWAAIGKCMPVGVARHHKTF